MASSLGINLVVSERQDKPLCFTACQVKNDITKDVTTVRYLNNKPQYVYDIETEDGTFNCGFPLIVKNTDSIYISNELFNKLDAAGYVGGELCQGKNDYGNGGIIFAMFIAPKVKYCITVDEQGRLSEKKTFKGYSQNKVKVEDYIQLYYGETLTTTVNKPWKRSLENGISIPDKNNNTEEKSFSAQINLLKRQAPDANGIMLPYNGEDVQDEIVQRIQKECNIIEYIDSEFTDNEDLEEEL